MDEEDEDDEEWEEGAEELIDRRSTYEGPSAKEIESHQRLKQIWEWVGQVWLCVEIHFWPAMSVQ